MDAIKSNNYNNNKENNGENKKEKEENIISFNDFLIYNIDIIPLLKQSILNQKKYISFIIKQLQKTLQNKENNKYNIFKSEKIFSNLVQNSKDLGIPFFYLLIKNEEFSKDIIFQFLNENLFKNEIMALIENIINIFNFDFKEKEIENPIEKYIKDLIDYGIIEQKDLPKNEKRTFLNEEEKLFGQIESILFNIKKYRELGKEVGKEITELFSSQIISCEQNLNSLKINDKIPISTIEFYQEKIEEMKNFKDKNPTKIEYLMNKKVDINETGNINKDFKEILTPEEIKNLKAELRKIPLKKRIYFFEYEQIISDENELTEFKNYNVPFGKHHNEELARQICSFINYNGGRIYLGINDNRIIIGVNAFKQKIFYENQIYDLVRNFIPKINEKEFLKLYQIPVRNNQNGKIIDNLFVFKILIKKGDPSKLYSISKEELICPIRLQGQCANLTAEEIHKKIIERNKYKNNQKNKIIEDYYEMNDPSPLKVQKIEDNKQKTKFSNNIEIKRNINNNKNNLKNNYKENNIKINNNENEKKYHKNVNNEKNDKNKKKNYDYILEVRKNKEIKNKEEENFNLNIDMNNQKKRRKKKKDNKKLKNGITRVEFTNVDKTVDEKTLQNLFREFNSETFKFYRNQNGISNGYLDFLEEKDADNFVEVCNNMTLGNRAIQLKKESLYY